MAASKCAATVWGRHLRRVWWNVGGRRNRFGAGDVGAAIDNLPLPLPSSMDKFLFLQHLAVLAIAYVLALPIAWNREREERSAGLRTFPLVALASCGFIQGTESALHHSPEAQARVIEGLITGVGFIGGGAILKHGASVHGTATAASLWATGAIGVATGVGAYDVAVMIAAITFLTLFCMTPLKQEGPENGDKAERDSHLSRPDDGR
jgi:putative Mg2+ transporter-C (MgtC) family protein